MSIIINWDIDVCIILIIPLLAASLSEPTMPSWLSENIQCSSWPLKNPPWALDQLCLPNTHHPLVQWIVSPNQPCWCGAHLSYWSWALAGLPRAWTICGHSLRMPAVSPQREELTSRTGSASHKWLGVCCRSGSPGRSWSRRWGRLSRSCRGHRSGWRAETPLGR